MKKQKYLQNTIGFTLVEIMIVILIIAILFAIAVPAWVSTRERSWVRTCMAQLGQIEYAKEVWAIDNHKLVTDTPTMDDLHPTYLKTQPACPAGGVYTINDLQTTPICSIGGEHRIR